MYTVITGASSGIGYETALAFARRGKNLIVVARRQEALEKLKAEVAAINPDLEVLIQTADLSDMAAVHSFYTFTKNYRVETWINNAGFGNFDSVAEQDMDKIDHMLRLNIEALTLLSSAYVSDYKDTEGPN